MPSWWKSSAPTYQIGQNAAPGSVVLRFGITNVYLKKHHRGLLSYTPGGFVVHAAKSHFNSFQKNIDLTGASIEAELILPGSNERLAAIVDNTGSRSTKKQFSSWEEFEAEMRTLAKRLKCRLDNAHVGESQRKNCDAM